MVLVTELELESLRVCYCQKDSLGVCVCVILRETGSVFSMQRAKASTSTFSRTLFPAKLSN